MADRISKDQRSKNMSAVKGSGNKSTELLFAKLLRAKKIKGWRRNQKIYGKPDFVFPKKKIVIFIDGCFWHGCKNIVRFLKQIKNFGKIKLCQNQKR